MNIMTVKEKTAAILEQNRGKYISGADIASELGVSRNAVWKAIKSLTAEGFQIDAVTNKGYCLAEGSDVLSEQSVKKYLPEELWEHLIVRHTVTSTNTLLKEMAAKGAPEGTIMIAAEQTAGKGRFDRKFVSEVCGVYFSIVLRPSIPASEALMITTAAAAATAEAVEAVSGRKTGIKWVNDVFIDGKKICGILTEAAFGMEGGGLDYAVLGIGINVKAPEGGFKGELANIADGVFGEDEDVTDARSRIAAEVIKRFFEYYSNLESKSYLEDYRKRSIVIGKEVILINGGTTQEAHVTGIDDDCRLLVTLPDGTEKAVSSGEISLRLK